MMGHTAKIKLPPIQEITNTARFQRIAYALNPGSRGYQLGQCSIFVTPPYKDEGWHLSISHPNRYPTWDEVAKARYELVPDEVHMVMHLPKMDEYVNIHESCFHLHELKHSSGEAIR
jgi:hypothetical protein